MGAGDFNKTGSDGLLRIGNATEGSSLTVTGGANYVGAPEVIFTGGTLEPGGSPATGYALIDAGAVVGIVITSPGAYSSAPTVTLTGGGGTGAAVTVGTLVANAPGGLTKAGAGTLTRGLAAAGLGLSLRPEHPRNDQCQSYPLAA